ncbi:hypothetical protein ACF0H5_015172 [Mactra antiquata]
METVYILLTIISIAALFTYQCECRMDCAQKNFKGSHTEQGKLFCGPGFHECGVYGDACCNNIEASTVQFVLVTLGPGTLVCTLILVICVICLGVKANKDEKAVIVHSERNSHLY